MSFEDPIVNCVRRRSKHLQCRFFERRILLDNCAELTIEHWCVRCVSISLSVTLRDLSVSLRWV